MGLLTKLWGKKRQEISTEPPARLSESSIQEWLVERIAAIAQIQPEEVEMDRPFAEFGMDSMQLFHLSGDLEKFLGCKVSEIIAWDYPTIAKLSVYLSSPESQVPASKDSIAEGELAGVATNASGTEPQL